MLRRQSKMRQQEEVTADVRWLPTHAAAVNIKGMDMTARIHCRIAQEGALTWA